MEALSNKPLVEAIFEMRWQLDEVAPNSGAYKDPNYRVMVGQLFDQLEDAYPYHEDLPSTMLPDEAAAGIVQHRFRVAKDTWPVIQVGPGILTLNDTEDYKWEDFYSRLSSLLSKFEEVQRPFRKRESLLLRYLDAVDFDYDKYNVTDFMADKMRTVIQVNPDVLSTLPSPAPVELDLRFGFATRRPGTVAHLRFAKGYVEERAVLVWETTLICHGQDVPQDNDSVLKWASDSHDICTEWFAGLSKGELMRSFR